MTSSVRDNLFGRFSGSLTADDAEAATRQLETHQKLLLASTAAGAYVVARYVLTLLGLPAVPGVSALLLHGQPFYGPLVVLILIVVLTVLCRPLVGRVRSDAPLFCAAVGLLALPTHGGDIRNALLDSGSPSVYPRMAVELLVLGVAVGLGYVALGRGGLTQRNEPGTAPIATGDDTAADRLSAVGVQSVVTLALLTILGQSPLKGQAMIGVALAGGLGAWLTYKTRLVQGSGWYVGGTLLAGLIGYLWTFFTPDGLPLGDTRGYLAGAARSLPIHYATAGVAGTIYGYWAGRTSAAGTEP